jgi:hypothetical protein
MKRSERKYMSSLNSNLFQASFLGACLVLCEEIQSISSFGEAIKLPDATSALEMVQKS